MAHKGGHEDALSKVNLLITQSYKNGLEAYQRGDYQTAEEQWKNIAERGHAEAQYRLGMIDNEKYHTLGHPSDLIAALKWLKMAHKGGHEDALSKVNLLITQSYKNGLEAYQRGDYQTAEEQWEPIAKHGHAEAQYHLWMIDNEKYQASGHPSDQEAALMWLELARKGGHGDALNDLKLMEQEGIEAYERGNYKYAFAKLGPIAEMGSGTAQHFTGLMYHKGQGVEHDSSFAKAYYTRSAKQGNILAQVDLALLYLKGETTNSDYKEAAKWFTLAAEQGNAEAHNHLGWLYLDGRGVTQDYMEAAKWFWRWLKILFAQATSEN